jgi:heme/copper-type cytochrome/quinol oxidase subunit 2
LDNSSGYRFNRIGNIWFFTWQKITDSTTDAKGEQASINIDITGHQFAWELRYPVKMVY